MVKRRTAAPLLCRRFMMDIPAGEHQNRGMAFQRSRKDLCSFHTKVDSIIFDRGNGGLRNTRSLGKFILA